jgi:hypothetical protein
MLFERGADVNVDGGNFSKLLLENGVKVKEPPGSFSIALVMALVGDHSEVADMLKRQGARFSRWHVPKQFRDDVMIVARSDRYRSCNEWKHCLQSALSRCNERLNT